MGDTAVPMGETRVLMHSASDVSGTAGALGPPGALDIPTELDGAPFGSANMSVPGTPLPATLGSDSVGADSKNTPGTSEAASVRRARPQGAPTGADRSSQPAPTDRVAGRVVVRSRARQKQSALSNFTVLQMLGVNADELRGGVPVGQGIDSLTRDQMSIWTLMFHDPAKEEGWYAHAHMMVKHARSKFVPLAVTTAMTAVVFERWATSEPGSETEATTAEFLMMSGTMIMALVAFIVVVFKGGNTMLWTVLRDCLAASAFIMWGAWAPEVGIRCDMAPVFLCGTTKWEHSTATTLSLGVFPGLMHMSWPASAAVMIIDSIVMAFEHDVSSWNKIVGLHMIATFALYQSARFRRESYLGATKMEESSENATKTLGFICHEIRNPLSGVLGNAEMLVETRLDVEQAEYVSDLYASCQQLRVVVNDVLDLTKIGYNKMQIESVPYSPHKIAKQAIAQMRTRAQKLDVSLSHSVDERVPHLVRGDPTRLLQCMNNYLGNALKFTPPGGTISLEVDVQETLGRGRWLVRFSVRDSGPGIAKADMSKLFLSFSQTSVSIARRHGGTGLGLTIVKELVELMEGDVGCDSELGYGATFWFNVVARAPTAEDLELERIPERDGSNAGSVSGGRLSGNVTPSSHQQPDRLVSSFTDGTLTARVMAGAGPSGPGSPQHRAGDPDRLDYAPSTPARTGGGTAHGGGIAAGAPTIGFAHSSGSGDLHPQFASDGHGDWVGRAGTPAPDAGAESVGTADDTGLGGRVTGSGTVHAGPLMVKMPSRFSEGDRDGPVRGGGNGVGRNAAGALDARDSGVVAPGGADRPGLAGRALLRSDSAGSAMSSTSKISTAVPPSTVSSATLGAGLAEAAHVKLPRLHALVVDDERMIRKWVTRMLTKKGLQVTCAVEGADALAKVKHAHALAVKAAAPDATDEDRAASRAHPPFEIISMDIQMGDGVNGVDATRSIRAFETEVGAPPTVIVAVTANNDAPDQEAYRDAGMDDIHSKPVHIPTLLETIAKLVRRRRVLVVDDSDVNCRLTARLLNREGHEAECASGKAEALDKVTAGHKCGRAFEMVLMDLNLGGGVDGLDVMQAIWNLCASERDSFGRPRAKPPVVVLSGDGERRDECLAKGAAHFMLKPIDREIVGDVVARFARPLSGARCMPGMPGMPGGLPGLPGGSSLRSLARSLSPLEGADDAE